MDDWACRSSAETEVKRMADNAATTVQNEPKAKWNAKDTVFVDLFHIPKYRYQLFQALHPEMTDVTEGDIEPVTLNPIILNQSYNDLGLLVKNRLIIFVEAQSTWSINILIRILLYLAMTYQNYITENNLYVYGSKKIEIPEPEFYVIFTGNRKFKKDTISLKEDFWKDSDAKVDVTAKVIYAENKEDIIGQYIIFSHVLDDQIRKYGRNKTAVEETIRICKSEGVLREYLESREKEVIDIMITLFGQEYAVEAYAADREKTGVIRNTVEMCQEFGATIEEAIQKLIVKFGLSQKDSEDYVEEFWKK